MAATLKRALQDRFSKYLNPEDPDFDPLPAVACLLAPDVAKVLFTDDMESLLIAAKKQIPTLLQTLRHITVTTAVHSSESGSAVPASSTSDRSDVPPLKKFKFLSERLSTSQQHPSLDNLSSIKMEVGRYLAECRLLKWDQDILDFWTAREQVHTNNFL